MSDQRIEIENAIACAFGIGGNAQRDGVVKSSQEYIDKRNDCIRRYADEIESLFRSSTPDMARLVGLFDVFCKESNPAYGSERWLATRDAIRSALADCEPKVCVWVRDVEHDKWDTDCDNAHCFIVGSPSFNNHNFCPYCGSLIKVKE